MAEGSSVRRSDQRFSLATPSLNPVREGIHPMDICPDFSLDAPQHQATATEPTFTQPGNAASTSNTADRVHLHAMWYLPQHTLLSGQCKDKLLLDRYTAIHNLFAAARILPPNVDLHLWLDCEQMESLSKPIITPSGVVHIPDDFLNNKHVILHSRQDLKALIEQEVDVRKRNVLKSLFDSPMNANIGMQSDIERGLYGYLYTDGSGKPSNEINLHVDIDTLSETLELAAARELLNQPRLPHSEYFPRCSDKQRLEIKLRALGMEISALKLPSPPEGWQPELKQKRDAGSGAAFAQIDTVSSTMKPRNNRTIEPVRIPRSILENGLMSRKEGNDYLALVPGHQRVFDMLDQIDTVVYEGVHSVDKIDEYGDADFFDDYTSSLRNYVLDLAVTNGDLHPEHSQGTIQKYVRLASKVMMLAPWLRDEIKKRDEGIAREMDSTKVGQMVLEKETMKEIYNICSSLVECAVNKTSYLPQIRNFPADEFDSVSSNKTLDDFFDFSIDVFGMVPPKAKTGTWKSDRSLEVEADAPDASTEEYQRIFREMKKFLGVAESPI
jgi:hypothetical protein